ncbi:hypothetical protein OV203_16505 [Nannocystis sp. ILAH1]|uniref:hypothetical protein n=1 Tax=Nannocystis sp. ILAH1 TaxID=2996789 RepID=UPI00226F74A0|nr:hypothetical protein [Nannocystis sp. ILAH1]MCY0988738.1 hypothetical protein [Nannocystis sp. ILAH1]
MSVVVTAESPQATSKAKEVGSALRMCIAEQTTWIRESKAANHRGPLPAAAIGAAAIARAGGSIVA